jgi:putative hydrolase of the HAD superfamily
MAFTPHTVTFDCWQTLIYQDDRTGLDVTSQRVRTLSERTGKEPERIREAFAIAWREHQRGWHQRRVFGGPEITAHVLQAISVELPVVEQQELVLKLEDQVLEQPVYAIEGARELLTELRASGVRVALICDTGFSPGRVVRQLLDRVGLLEHLEVQIFSNEICVPKPHLRAFSSALEGLGVSAQGAVHVGDLRRSDIAGARDAGMGTFRFRGKNDDTVGRANAGVIGCDLAGCTPVCEEPEADSVVASYAELRERLIARE